MKKFNQLAKKKKKKKILTMFLSSIKTKIAIKFPKKLFSAENQLDVERVNKNFPRIDTENGDSDYYLRNEAELLCTIWQLTMDLGNNFTHQSGISSVFSYSKCALTCDTIFKTP